MTIPSIIILGDLKDSPSLRMELPSLLPIGERILLSFMIRRRVGNRTEEIRVEDGEFRVVSSSLDARSTPRQLLTVESTKVAPSWKAIKNPPPAIRVLPPTHSKGTVGG
jgi:hypothetical protein